MRGVLKTIGIALGLLAGPGIAAASTLLIPTDVALLSQASVVAEVSVMSASPSPAEGTPSTDYVVLVERLLKGRIGGSSVVVRVPGGIGADGIGLSVHGAPAFREGEKALLFLGARRDGTYGILHLSLGAFRQQLVMSEGVTRVLAARELLEASVPAPGFGIDPVRDWEAFIAWLTGRAAGEASAPDYFLPVQAPKSLVSGVDTTSAPIAWGQFSRKRRVRWRLPQSTGSGAGPNRRMLRRALASWASADSSAVRFGIAAARVVAPSTRSQDGENSVIVDDPDDLMTGSFSCRSGGIASLSVTWFDPAVTFRYRAGPEGVATQALEADVVVNDGAECLLAVSSEKASSAAELSSAILAHEIGHTLGLEHSADPSSLMFPIVLDHGGLAAAGSAELERLWTLYPSRAAVAGSVDSDGRGDG